MVTLFFMKIKLLIITILLLFVSLSSEIIALEIPITNEVELVLEENEDVWAEDYGSYGSAWVFFSPPAGFQPGPYSVLLKVEGTPVATIDFLVQP